MTTCCTDDFLMAWISDEKNTGKISQFPRILNVKFRVEKAQETDSSSLEPSV